MQKKISKLKSYRFTQGHIKKKICHFLIGLYHQGKFHHLIQIELTKKHWSLYWEIPFISSQLLLGFLTFYFII